MPLEHGERVTILCMVLHWHRRTFLRLGSAVMRRIVLSRMFRFWLQGAARQQDAQVAERMEREMGLPPNTLLFAYEGEPLPTFGLGPVVPPIIYGGPPRGKGRGRGRGRGR